jgi:hypothetical protein
MSICSVGTLVFSQKTPIFRCRIQCPVLKIDKSCKVKDLQDAQKGAYKPAYKKFQKTAQDQLQNIPAELAEIVAIWPELPVHIKAAMKALIQAYKESE